MYVPWSQGGSLGIPPRMTWHPQCVSKICALLLACSSDDSSIWTPLTIYVDPRQFSTPVLVPVTPVAEQDTESEKQRLSVYRI